MSQSPLVSIPGNSTATVSRRSTRIEKSIPLIVMGQNRMGEPFFERTVSVTVNMHGCRYGSRHDYGVGTWVTLQMVGLNNPDEKPATVRAVVRSIHPAASLRELQQVGVELETPSNVWGIVPTPADWLSARGTSTSTARIASASAPAQESAPKKAGVGEILMTPEPKVAEIASFPSPSPVASRPPTPKVPEATQPARVVVSPDGLISAIQGKLQREAEKAVQAAVAKQVNDAVRQALSSIDEARQSSVREVQELLPKQIEAIKSSLKGESIGEMPAQWKADMETYRGRAEEMAQRLEEQARELRRELANAQEVVGKITREVASPIPARLNEAVTRATSDFESAAAVIVDRRYERLLENLQVVTQDALLKLNARSAEVHALVQGAVNCGLEDFRREAEQHSKMVLAETKERAVSALASLDAESRNACDARRQALETEVARSAERATEQFRREAEQHVNMVLAETKDRAVSALAALDADSRNACDARRQALEAEVARFAERATEQFQKGMKAFLYSCLVAAVGAVDEHSKATLEGLLKSSGKTLDEARS